MVESSISLDICTLVMLTWYTHLIWQEPGWMFFWLAKMFSPPPKSEIQILEWSIITGIINFQNSEILRKTSTFLYFIQLGSSQKYRRMFHLSFNSLNLATSSSDWSPLWLHRCTYDQQQHYLGGHLQIGKLHVIDATRYHSHSWVCISFPHMSLTAWEVESLRQYTRVSYWYPYISTLPRGYNV